MFYVMDKILKVYLERVYSFPVDDEWSWKIIFILLSAYNVGAYTPQTDKHCAY